MLLIALEPQRTRAGVDDDGVLTVAAGHAQGVFDFPLFGVGLFRQAFAGEGLAAAQRRSILGQDHLETGPSQQGGGFHRQGVRFGIALGRPHGAAGATGEIHDARTARRRLGFRLGQRAGGRHVAIPQRNPIPGQLARGSGHPALQPGAENPVGEIGCRQAETGRGGHAGELLRHQAAGPLRDRTPLLPALLQHHGAGVDADRAGQGTQAVGGAGVHALILVSLSDYPQAVRVFARRSQARHFAQPDDALPRRQRQSAGRTVRLAKAALDALVHQRIDGRHRLDIFEVRFRVVVEDDAGIEQVARIEQRLDFPHQSIRLLAPFQLDERRDVAAGAVLRFQRAVVLVDDHPAHVVHEIFVAFGFGGIGKVGRDDEMQIAFERVAENDRAGITMLVEKALQIERHRRQSGHRDRDILDDDGGAGRPRRADRGKQTLADRPQLGEFFGPVGELVGVQGR